MTFFQCPCVQVSLGVLALGVVAFSVWVLITLPTLEDVQIVQALSGPKVVQLILGVAFGCILRYWGPHFWEMRMRPGTRYNWVAISLVGLLLLAPAIPYIERQLGGMTGLKTPVAEFQFAGVDQKSKNLLLFKPEREASSSKVIPAFAQQYKMTSDLVYLNFFPPDKIAELTKIYRESLSFTKSILVPLNQCSWRAYESYLDTESIRHELSPVAQNLRQLIQQGKRILALLSQGSTIAENKDKLKKAKETGDRLRTKLLWQVHDSLWHLRKAILKEPKREGKPG